jgi:DNA-binding response OmpR family regulator
MRILVIEDNPKMAQAIQISLRQQGYHTEMAATASEGEELARSRNYDAIILDLMLPDRDGKQLCRELRRHKIATPILMLTALGSTDDKVAGLDSGADDYLTKPFHLEELLARVRSLLRRHQPTEGDVLRSRELELDVVKHVAKLRGAPIKLSAKEFALLEYMMRNPNKLLTRAMISEKVWDMNYEPSSNVIDVYVSSLRRKIDRGATKPWIETVIGSGYRFIDDAANSEEPQQQTAERS